jgi:hypothetical protein
MKIELSQSGGFAGETIKLKEISSDKISGDDKIKLDSLLKDTDFFNIKPQKYKKEVGADLLTYTLKITKSKNQHNEVSFDDSVSDNSLLKLVSLIRSMN